MENIKKLFDEIRDNPKKTEKERIIRENRDDNLFSTTINFLLNPYIVTGLSGKKINKDISNMVFPAALTQRAEDAKATDVMEFLKTHNTGADFDIYFVQRFIETQPEEMKLFYKELFTKSYRLGCAENTVNKAFDYEFIPKFECMLANNYFEHQETVRGNRFTITNKLDGIRCLAIIEGDNVSLFSRQGQQIEGLVDVESDLKKAVSNYILDGELLPENRENYPSKEQYKITTQIVRKDGEKHGIVFNVFDGFPVEIFRTKGITQSYEDRRAELERTITWRPNLILLPKLYSGGDTSKIIEYLNIARTSGEEGVMVNLNNAPYRYRRTNDLLKCKVMQDCDLEILRIDEGAGRLQGTTGTIIVDYKGRDLGVGSGLTDMEREWFWKNRDVVTGRIITVQYFEETMDSDKNLSLRFPVFKELRDIGKEPNI